jgi:hypothetical protein
MKTATITPTSFKPILKGTTTMEHIKPQPLKPEREMIAAELALYRKALDELRSILTRFRISAGSDIDENQFKTEGIK